MTEIASKLHEKGGQAREENRHIEALKLLAEAIFQYQVEKNYSGLVGALQDRVLTNKHLFWKTNDLVFAIQAKSDAQASLEVAKLHNLSEKLGSCYFRLGEVAMLFGEYAQAVLYYQKALENYQGTNCEKGDYRYHLGEALYRNGEKEEGKKTMLEGLKEVQENAAEVDPFLAHVWESGCFLRLAELLKDSQPSEAKGYLEKAREIIKTDPKLVIRKRQLEELEKEFK